LCFLVFILSFAGPTARRKLAVWRHGRFVYCLVLAVVSYRLRSLSVASYILEVIPIRRGCVESFSRLRTVHPHPSKRRCSLLPQSTNAGHGSPSLGGGKENQEEGMGTTNRFDSIRIRKNLLLKHASISCRGRRNVSKVVRDGKTSTLRSPHGTQRAIHMHALRGHARCQA
jgi:hypothetical protein